jgi:hypothetical protein
VKLNYIFSVIVVAMVVILGYTSTKLADLLIKDMYQDAAGRAKKVSLQEEKIFAK